MFRLQVLPTFCKVFMSDQPNVGPSGQDVNSWLSGVMDGMVTAIDENVIGVLKGQQEAANKADAERQPRLSQSRSSTSKK